MHISKYDSTDRNSHTQLLSVYATSPRSKLKDTYSDTVKPLMFVCPLFREPKNREIKGCKYQRQANISNCMVLIRQNKRGLYNFAC